jgi:hypothetical protein
MKHQINEAFESTRDDTGHTHHAGTPAGTIDSIISVILNVVCVEIC